MKFIATTLVSLSQLLESIANYCVMFGRYRSFLGTTALLCCDRYNWSLSELIVYPEPTVLSIFHLNVGILMVYLTFKLVSALCPI